MNREYIRVINKYEKERDRREKILNEFKNGNRQFLIFHTSQNKLFDGIRTKEECFEENIRAIDAELDMKGDNLPFMEPWFGTGTIANVFGCPVIWRDDNAPTVHYKYLDMYDVKDIPTPSWKGHELTDLVLDTLHYFKEHTGDALPMAWTDTQSASDTATLILDASEVFAGCLIEKELMHEFFKKINDVTLDFSKKCSEIIGEKALMRPGHIMAGGMAGGMAVSDDNLAVASPDVNKEFNLYYNNLIGEEMGGVAIHSCGEWTYTMPYVKEYCPTCVAIDCAVHSCVDPNPNVPEKIRDAMKGTGIPVHCRITGETHELVEITKRLFDPQMKLIIHPISKDEKEAAHNYDVITELLTDLYNRK